MLSLLYIFSPSLLPPIPKPTIYSSLPSPEGGLIQSCLSFQPTSNSLEFYIRTCGLNHWFPHSQALVTCLPGLTICLWPCCSLLPFWNVHTTAWQHTLNLPGFQTLHLSSQHSPEARPCVNPLNYPESGRRDIKITPPTLSSTSLGFCCSRLHLMCELSLGSSTGFIFIHPISWAFIMFQALWYAPPTHGLVYPSQNLTVHRPVL